MHELTADELPAALEDSEVRVFVKLRYRKKYGSRRSAAEFLGEKRALQRMGCTYVPALRVWEVPAVVSLAAPLRRLLSLSSAVVYAAEVWEPVEVSWFE